MPHDSLTPRQRAVLAAICETLVPDAPGMLERVERLVGLIEDPGARARLKLLLGVLGNPLANLVLSGRAGALHRMPPGRRLAVLRNWAHSRLALKRAGFQALKRLTQVAYYG